MVSSTSNHKKDSAKKVLEELAALMPIKQLKEAEENTGRAVDSAIDLMRTCYNRQGGNSKLYSSAKSLFNNIRKYLYRAFINLRSVSNHPNKKRHVNFNNPSSLADACSYEVLEGYEYIGNNLDKACLLYTSPSPRDS